MTTTDDGKRKKTGGRTAGTPNKVTASAKDAVMQTFDKLGGVPAFVRWAKLNPGDFYAMFAKLIPKEHVGKGGGPIQHNAQVYIMVPPKQAAETHTRPLEREPD